MKIRENTTHPLHWMTIFLLAGLGVVTTVVSAEAPEKASRGLALMGESIYRDYCTSCHGAEAHGDGPVAEALKPVPADLTRLTENGEFPYERVLKKIDGREPVAAHGSSDMPIWGDVLRAARGGAEEDAVDRKIAALAHYLWTIQADGEAGR